MEFLRKQTKEQIGVGSNKMTINDNLNRILEKRKNKNPGVYTIKKIADYLGLTVDELLK